MERFGDSSKEIKDLKCQALAKVNPVPEKVTPRTGNGRMK